MIEIKMVSDSGELEENSRQLPTMLEALPIESPPPILSSPPILTPLPILSHWRMRPNSPRWRIGPNQRPKDRKLSQTLHLSGIPRLGGSESALEFGVVALEGPRARRYLAGNRLAVYWDKRLTISIGDLGSALQMRHGGEDVDRRVKRCINKLDQGAAEMLLARPQAKPQSCSP